MLETNDLNAAVAAVRRDLAVAHNMCPNECPPLESIPTQVKYNKRAGLDEKGAFFELPQHPSQHPVIHIAAIFNTHIVKYFVENALIKS